MKWIFRITGILLMLSQLTLAQDRKEIDPGKLTFPVSNPKKWDTDEKGIQQLSKQVAAFLQQSVDSAWTLTGTGKDIQFYFLYSSLFSANEYEKIPGIIKQFRKYSSNPSLRRIGGSIIDSYVKAMPYKLDTLLFKQKYEEAMSSNYQNATVEDMDNLQKNITYLKGISVEKEKAAWKAALTADTVTNIGFYSAINLIQAYNNIRLLPLTDVEMLVYKKHLTRLEILKGNPISAKFKLPTTPVAITNVNIVNVISGKADPGQTIIMDGKKIVTIGISKKIKIPVNATLIDGTGKYAMPGMTDAHMHFYQSGGLYTRPEGINIPTVYPYAKDQQWLKDNMYDLMARYLACGITNVVSLGGPMSYFDIREKANNDITSPNVLSTGPLIGTVESEGYNKGDLPIIKAGTPEEARNLVKKQLPFKPDFIKILYIVKDSAESVKYLPIVKAAIDEAHANGLKVAVHATEHENMRLSVEAGADILVHSLQEKGLDEPMLALFKRKNIVYIPTLQVEKNYEQVYNQHFTLTAHDFKYANPFMLGTTMDLQHIDPAVSGRNYKERRTWKYAFDTYTDSIMAKNVLLVLRAGINVVAGSDAGNIGTHHGSSYLRELLMLKAAGFSETDVLRSATINAAKGFGKEKEWGSIEENKMADILLLDKNPLADLSALDNIPIVIHRGVVIKTDDLLTSTPESLVQQQVNAYNARDLQAFMQVYSDSVELYNFPDKLIAKGKAEMQKGYVNMFKTTPDLHCEIVKRIVLNNTIIDHERISGFGDKKKDAIAIYKVENGKIAKVYFQ